MVEHQRRWGNRIANMCGLGRGVVGLAVPLLCSSAALAQYTRTDLVSDQPGVAAHQDMNLVNPWGIVFNPTGFVWVADNGTGLSTLYNGTGVPQSLVVSIPTPTSASDGAPTGIVFNGSPNYVVTNNGLSGPAFFMFATEDGVISGWNPTVATTSSFIVVNRSQQDAIYKGLAATADTHLLAADFHNGRIDVFNGDFALNTALAFNDPTIPTGYAPFNVRTFNGKVYVTYALQDADRKDDVPGPGHGYLNVFNLDGTLDHRLVSQGVLNSPWGLAIAPANFGALSGALLVGNFGDGRINAFDAVSGASRGTLNDANGAPIEIEGLWGIEFGNDRQNQPSNTLFFASGPDDEAHGLYGRLDTICYANCDNSIAAPVLNVNDFICFQTRFVAGDTYANCDGSTTPPVLTVDDFICFQQRFAAGCP